MIIAPRREQEARRSERTRTREQEIEHQSGQHGRQAQKRVAQHDHGVPSEKPGHGQQRAERRADHQRNDTRAQADPQRQRDDAGQLRIEPDDQGKRRGGGLGKIVHPGQRVGGGVEEEWGRARRICRVLGTLFLAGELRGYLTRQMPGKFALRPRADPREFNGRLEGGRLTQLEQN